ncbi:Autophagy-related protein 29 [Blumeria hordei DH14]|uniref:Autophagy-related protein 29 n=1 Tax=Blumeria graminis f. sp. hordei (strain DH14) TaxID=546991 RepID=N1J9S8_BLUG1|nr:Autophagy-related protein 29 [Blumeria hordei DH14]
MSVQNSSFIVFIRLPFPRKDFVDPPPVDWDAVKDKQLWKIISNASKVSAIDWNELAAEFRVPLPFLLQQVAWLYERQMQQVQAQMRKARLSTGTAIAPVHLGSKSEDRRVAVETDQNLSTGPNQRRETTVSNATVENQKYGIWPSTSQPSTLNTITTYQNAELTTHSLGTTIVQKLQSRSRVIEIPRLKTHAPAKDSSDSQSDSDSHLPTSPRHRKLSYASNSIGRKLADEDDDDLAFLPYTPPINKVQGDTKCMATSHNRNDSDQAPSSITRAVEQQPQSSNISSLSPKNRGPLYNQANRKFGSGISSKWTSEADVATSGAKGKSVEKNDSTPSTGSSFSDLDDSSVTQSALEEALASNMQAGAMASRMSTISQALRSKYL